MKTKVLAGALGLGLSVSCAVAAGAKTAADTVFVDGNVIPMTGPSQRAQAVAVKDGKILAVGTNAEIEALRGEHTDVVDLGGKTLLPGFIDAHGHITLLARQIDFANLSAPPVGKVTDIPSLLDVMRAQAAKQPDGWIVGIGYDDAELAEKRHPDRHELDRVSTDRPALIWHVSGHLMSANTKALEMLGMLRPAGDPPRGVIRREADGKTASGVLEEGAMLVAMEALPTPNMDRQLEQLREAEQVYASYGLTSAEEGAAPLSSWTLLDEAARRNELMIDVHVLPRIMANWPNLDGLPFNAPYRNHLRVAGVKIILDGSPQGRTAWLSQPYFKPPPGHDNTYAGYQQVSDADLQAALLRAANNGWQVYVHVNGDAAIQQLIDNVRIIDQKVQRPLRRTIAIHSQTARRDQLEQMKALDIEPTFFASHTFYWGDWHREVVLGPERADHISPQKTAFDLGLHPTIHNDTPVVPPDVIRLIWSAATRRTRSGDILGPSERVTPYQALMEVTSNAAYEIHEEGLKGSLEPGKLADFVVLDIDPLSIDPEKWLSVHVLATIKEGHYIYRAASTH